MRNTIQAGTIGRLPPWLIAIACCSLLHCNGETASSSRIGAGGDGASDAPRAMPGGLSPRSSRDCPPEVPRGSDCDQPSLECLYDRGAQQGCFICQVQNESEPGVVTRSRWVFSVNGCGSSAPPECGDNPGNQFCYTDAGGECVYGSDCYSCNLLDDTIGLWEYKPGGCENSFWDGCPSGFTPTLEPYATCIDGESCTVSVAAGGQPTYYRCDCIRGSSWGCYQ